MSEKRDAARDNWNAYVRARDSGHDEWVEIAEKCNRFYAGGGRQWAEADRQRLEREGKPVLEVNMILSTVNALMGERINQRAEIRFRPARGGVAQLAEAVLTPLARHIQDDNNYHWVEGEMFADGVIQDRGYIDIRMNFDLDLRGEVRMTALDPMTVLPDPLAQSYDTREWNEVTTTRWMTLEEIEEEYGKEHRKEIETFALGGDPYGRYEQDCIEWVTRDHHFGDTEDVTGIEERQSPQIQRVRVIERQHKKLANTRFFVDGRTGDMQEIPDDMEQERIAELAESLEMGVVERVKRRIRWTISVGDHVIKDIWSPYNHFTIVGFFPYWRRGKPFGVVRNLISPQEQLNKAESQELHIINTTANSGYLVEAGSLVNMTEEDLEARGAETGLVIAYRSGAQPPVKIAPNSVPSGISNVSQKAAGAIKAISGVYDSMLGDTGREVSGVKLETQIDRNLTQMQVPFDNLNRTRQIIGEIMYSLIRDYYTEERVYHVADFNQPGAPIIPVEINKELFDGSILHDITVGEYGVTVDVGPAHNNVQETQFAEALQLREAGVGIPDYAVIENSHLLHRHELAEQLRQMQGLGEKSPEQQQMEQQLQMMQMEMMKAELANSQAKAALLQAQAMEAQAQAMERQMQPQIKRQELEFDAQLEMRKLEQRWAELQANLQNKLQLAGVHSQNKSEATRFTTLAKQTSEGAKLQQAERQALLQYDAEMQKLKQPKSDQPAKS